MPHPDRHRIDWEVPAGKPDWLFGTGATRTERNLVWLAVVITTAAVVALAGARQNAWSWWQWAILVLIIVDVVGGVVANSLGTAKRLYTQEPTKDDDRLRRFMLNHHLFAAAHIHPFLLVGALGDAEWDWAAYWYIAALAAVTVIRATPTHLQRPIGLAILTVSLILGSAIVAPDGLGWFGPTLMLKLAVAHSITEAPFRPPTRQPTATRPCP